MSDIFISNARSTEPQATQVAEALRGLGYLVWRDDELPAHRAYTDVIDERLEAAKAVVVIWSAEAVRSEWVQSEADTARKDHKLVQLTVDGSRLPRPFDRVQCADLIGWTGDLEAPGWKKVAASVADLVGGDAPAPTTRPAVSAAPPLPDKPSIAVLPFADPGGALGGDYFADGMVDEIVTALSRFPSLFVIASGSSLSYRGRERDYRRIGRELGVRYLLEGSVRRSGPKVRIAVDLVEAETRGQAWSERFEGTLEDVFALQDEVASAVAAHIEPTIEAAQLRRSAARPTEDLGAYDLFLRAQQRVREFDQTGNQAAIDLFERAVARDPRFGGAWAFLARLYTVNLLLGWTAEREGTAHKARDAIRNALLTNDDDGVALAHVAFAAVGLGGDRHSSQTMADRALALNPGSFMCWVFAGWVSSVCEQCEQAVERFKHALRLNPRAPERQTALVGMGAALVRLQRFEEAIPWIDEAIMLRPNFPNPIFTLAIALAQLGRIEEARGALARFEALGSLKSTIDTLSGMGGWSETYLPALRRIGVEV